MKVAQRLAATIAGGIVIGMSGVAVAETVLVTLKGYEEVPAVSSRAAGHFRAFIDDKAPAIAYELTYDGLEGDVRQSHIHFGQKGVSGGISVYLCQTSFNADPTGLAPTCPQSGTVTGTLTAANIIGPAGQGIAATEIQELIAAIRAGIAYPNVHSTKFPTGEIRGQLQ
jgi:hypothetical protein